MTRGFFRRRRFGRRVKQILFLFPMIWIPIPTRQALSSCIGIRVMHATGFLSRSFGRRGVMHVIYASFCMSPGICGRRGVIMSHLWQKEGIKGRRGVMHVTRFFWQERGNDYCMSRGFAEAPAEGKACRRASWAEVESCMSQSIFEGHPPLTG